MARVPSRTAAQNANSYPFLNQIEHRPTRDAVKQIYDQLAQLQSMIPEIGTLTQPLGVNLMAGNNQLKQLADPTHPQDAVTLQYLQSYMANFASAFPGSQGAAGGGTTPPTPAGKAAAPTNHQDIVEAVRVSLGINASSTNFQLFKFAQTVAWQIALTNPDPLNLANCGLLMQMSGDGVYTCNGITYATFRICYNNGANIKILTGSYTSQWTQEADVPLTDFHVATDPAVDCP